MIIAESANPSGPQTRLRMIEDETPILNKYDKNKILNKKSGEFDNGNKNNHILQKNYE